MASGKDPYIDRLLGSITETSILSHLRELVGVRHAVTNPEGLQRAATYLIEKMKSYDLEVEEDTMEGVPEKYANIIGHLRRRTPSQKILLVGAHYDTIADSPGADDNASGIAVMLEVARVLAPCVSAGKRTVQFAGFTLEEAGFLGSEHYAQEIRRKKLPFLGAIVLECVGFVDDHSNSQAVPPGLTIKIPNKGNFIGLVGNQAAKGITEAFESAARRYVSDLPVASFLVPGRGEQIPDSRRSDHVPFWDRGYQGLLLTDTANFRNPHYHRPTDQLDTLNIPFIVSVARTLAAMLVETVELSGE
ncbi:MAG TPA: M28 family peptidase [Nitrospiria bacterium]|nr:M28 family peptidase [Nitrospiria bacterium]